MRLPLRNSNRKNNRRSNGKFQYETLEDRRVLTTVVAFNAGDGTLTVNVSAPTSTADIGISNGNISVNGSEDTDSALPNDQTIAFTELRNIVIVGTGSQSASFNGNYSTGNGGLLQSLTASNITDAVFANEYDLGGDLSLTLSGSGGSISDGTNGRVSVSGTTTLLANDNTIAIDNAANDFNGDVNATTTGTDRDISLADANSIRFDTIVSSGDLLVTAVADVSDVSGSTISATDGRFNAANVVLGENVADNVMFSRFEATTTGTVNLSQENTVILLDITADDLTVQTPAGIFDGRSTNISVVNQATFDAGARIRIGENGTDTFNAGQLNFNAGGHASIWEDSSTEVFGANTASSLILFSSGDLIDEGSASINVTNVTGLEAQSVVLGDTGTDEFRTGALHFNTPGDFFLNAESDIHMIDSKNSADRLNLVTPGSITDADDAGLNVTRLSIFNANSVDIGDTSDDSFNSGSILFNTAALFKLSENSSTNIISSNSANNAIIESTGNITDIFTSTTGNGSTINVTTVAEFTGANITLGEETNDTMNFGAIRFNSPGEVTISVNSATNLTLESTANELNLTSTGGIRDAAEAKLNVTGVADIQGSLITLGDTATDEFNAGSVTLNSAGAVNVTENSNLNLTGTSLADSMTLVAAGLLTDGDNANTTATNLLSVTGSLISLGGSATDTVSASQLTFNSTLNTDIELDSSVELFGASNSADQLFLSSTGDISDAATADTLVENGIVLNGVNIELGELSDDCFDIVSGDINDLVVNASGTNSVILGC